MNNINLNELSLENIDQWPKPVKIGAVVALFLLVTIGGYWFLVKPNIEQYDTLQRKEKSLKSVFELKQRQAASLNQYRNQLQIMKEKFGNMLRRLPAKQEMPGLLEDISRTGIASGLKFELFDPTEEVKHDFYFELPIKIRVIGNYHQLAVFLSRIAELSRIVTVHDFVIKRVIKNPDDEGSGNKLVMEITAKIYRYRTQ